MTPVARLAALLVVVGCGGRTTAPLSSAGAKNDGGMANRLEGGPATSSAPDASVPGESPLDASAAEDGGPDVQGATPSGLTAGATVWIGQSDMTVSYPPGYDGGATVSAAAPSVSAPEKVVLILNAATNPVVGTITFGDDTPPPPATDPMQPYPPEPTAFVEPNGQTTPFGPLNPNLGDRPFPGFSYSLVSSSLTGGVLDLAFVPSELFQSYCVLQHSTQNSQDLTIGGGSFCVCDGGACNARTIPFRRFELAVDGNMMQGQLSFPTAGFLAGTVDIRLERVE
ncbi:MAG TPA: hypothetical protein VKU41_30575 [Polyangiaceae bacterium]|nr:hypothetical protein [Polyangiaceae bacterium]